MAADHDRWTESVAPYLLGALPDGELETFEAHLAHCADCREELDALLPAVRALPNSVEPMAPPPALKARIMAEVQREASLLAAAGPAADEPPAAARRRRLPRFSMPRLATVAAAAALLFVGVAIGFGVSQLGSDGPKTVQASVDARLAPAAGAEVEMTDKEATLVAHGLPPAPTGRVYQVWLKRAGQAPEATSALFLPASDGTATATVTGPLDDVTEVMVTDEPMGGSKVPSREPFLVADMS
jgi:anti-sigma-K factor RskA